MASPAVVPDNELTRQMAALSTVNTQLRAGSPVGTTSPAVRSAAIGPVPEEPLSPGELEYRNQRARELGIHLPGDEDDDPQIAAVPSRGAPAVTPAVPTAAPTPPSTPGRPTLPDFRKVQRVDIEHAVLWVDGMPFPIDAVTVADFKEWAIKVVTDVVTQHLASALFDLRVERDGAEGTADAPDETLLDVPATEAADSVPEAAGEASGPTAPVPGVPSVSGPDDALGDR